MEFPEDLRHNLSAYLRKRRGKGRLRQLVLVSTAWRAWRGGEDASGGRPALEALLRFVAGPADLGEGRAWCAMATGDEVPWEEWRQGREASALLERFLGLLKEGDGDEDARPIPERVRILCDPRRAGRLLPEGAPETGHHWTELDVRFLKYAGSVRVHFTFSFWGSAPPFVPAHPFAVPDEEEPAQSDFERLSREVAERLVEEYFGPVTTRVREHYYAPPMFWVLALDGVREPGEHLGGDPLAESLIRSLLRRGVGDDGVAQSLVDGSVLALRWFGRLHEGDTELRPVYLLVPRPPAEVQDDSDDRAVRLAQDLAVRAVAALLTEIEARAAAEMHELDRSLLVWKTHVDVYDAAGQQASLLWDALALHMPVGSDRRLADTHRGVELVHQTLLQGVADLAVLIRRVDLLRAQVDALEEGLSDLLDLRLAERSPQSEQRLREAFLRTSHLGHLRRLAENVRQSAASVDAQYRDLLASIGHAFDERRVREVDVLQKAGGAVAMVGALFSSVTLLDFLFDINTDPSKWSFWPHWWTNPALGIATSAGALWLGYKVFAIQRGLKAAQKIGSPRFHRHYGRLLSYLRDASTMHLDRLRDQETPDWRTWDEGLSTRFAELWDEATLEPPGRSLWPGRGPGREEFDPDLDIAQLAEDAERWTLRALLLTERPRRLSEYRLPRLTLLYRHCTGLERARSWKPSVPVVHDAELESALVRAGRTAEAALLIDRRITARLADPGTAPQDTGALLELVTEVLDVDFPEEAER